MTSKSGKKPTQKAVLFRIEKYFQGGSGRYFIKVKPAEVTETLLEKIGEMTSGGHAYGYRIKATRIRKLPKGAKLLRRTVHVPAHTHKRF